MKRFTVTGFVLLCAVATAHAEMSRYFDERGYTVEFFEAKIVEADQWVPYPSPDRAEEWQRRLPPEKHAGIVANAERHIGFDWPVGKATVFLDYVEDGNRTRFEKLQFVRRNALIALVLGELLEGKGRFVSDIVDGIWAISEESFWGVPAHLSLQERGTGLPDVNDPVVDLFAAQTAQILAWTSQLLADQLDAVHPMIRERIYIEIDRRMFRVIESRPDYRWMGTVRKVDDPSLSYERRSFLERRPNNWNPWINSNLLTCILLLEKDKTRRAEFVHHILGYLGNYLEPFPADGGSDEGTGYWGHAAASVFDNFDLLTMATEGAFSEFGDPLIRNMGEFIAKAYVGRGYYINFADASPTGKHSPVLIYRFGKAVDSQVMMDMAGFLAATGEFSGSIPGERSMMRVLPELFHTQELLAAGASEPLVANSWLPDIQVMTSRDTEGSTAGLYLAAKAGHNEESHNHNDVGSFIVFKDGYPAIIDVGSATYTRNYGNEWVRESAYHNLLPVIGEHSQRKGRKYSARNVGYEETGASVAFSQDFAGAYGDEADLRSWERTIQHDKGGSISIVDEYEFNGAPTSVMLPMMFRSAPDLSAKGVIIVTAGDGSGVHITYDADQFDTELEEIDLADTKIATRWGELYRLQFRLKSPSAKGGHRFVIR